MNENRVMSTEEVRVGKPDRKSFRLVPRYPVTIVLDGIKSASNLGNIFRLADAFRIEKVWICGCSETRVVDVVSQNSVSLISTKKFRKSAFGIERWVPWSAHFNAVELLTQLKADGHSLVSVELTNGATSLDEFEFETPLVLVFGHEQRGVSEAVQSFCDESVFIPMQGMGNSINLATCVGIALYAVLPFCALKGEE